jgi:hypothetical protein
MCTGEVSAISRLNPASSQSGRKLSDVEIAFSQSAEISARNCAGSYSADWEIL